MRPSTQYVEIGTIGLTPNVLHQISVNVDDQIFIGAAKTKKMARKFAAREACNKLFGTNFPAE